MKPLPVFSASDEGCAPGVQAAWRGALVHATGPLHFTLLDGGIADSSWAAIESSLRRVGKPFECRRVSLSPGLIADLPQKNTHSAMTYGRLLMARWIHDDRVVYLDSDILVRRDLQALTRLPMEGRAMLAVQDGGLRTFGGEGTAWDHWGIDPAEAYFNAGFLFVDLARWRAEDIENQAFRFIRDHAERIACEDQSALNFLFRGRWSPLGREWNHILPRWSSPTEEAAGWNLHYVGKVKPWLGFCPSRRRAPYLQALDPIGRRGASRLRHPIRTACEFWRWRGYLFDEARFWALLRRNEIRGAFRSQAGG